MQLVFQEHLAGVDLASNQTRLDFFLTLDMILVVLDYALVAVEQSMHINSAVGFTFRCRTLAIDGTDVLTVNSPRT